MSNSSSFIVLSFSIVTKSKQNQEACFIQLMVANFLYFCVAKNILSLWKMFWVATECQEVTYALQQTGKTIKWL